MYIILTSLHCILVEYIIHLNLYTIALNNSSIFQYSKLYVYIILYSYDRIGRGQLNNLINN